MTIAARIIGGIFLLLWLVLLPGTHRFMRAQKELRLMFDSDGSRMVNGVCLSNGMLNSYAFQRSILPFLMGVFMIASGNLWSLAVLPVVWMLSLRFSSFFFFQFPLVMGWVLGAHILRDVFPDSMGWYWGGGSIGVVVMLVVGSFVTWFIELPKGTALPPRDREQPGSM